MILSMEIWHDTKDEVMPETNMKIYRASYDSYIIQKTYIRKNLNKYISK